MCRLYLLDSMAFVHFVVVNVLNNCKTLRAPVRKWQIINRSCYYLLTRREIRVAVYRRTCNTAECNYAPSLG